MGGSRVCFVVSDLLGTVANSGIATATSYGALVLARAGHEVTLVHTRDGVPVTDAWAERYAAAGVKVEAIPGAIVSPPHMNGPKRVLDHLKDRQFDTIVFQDWLGLGWACMVARSQGLSFHATQMVHICHGPDAWLHHANGDVRLDNEALATAELGRVSAELADTIVGPSRYLIDWMAAAGWKLPDRQIVVPYFTRGQVGAMERGDRWVSQPPLVPVPLREVAFFGRLECRKGVRVFTDALNRVDPALLQDITISFLGREATYTTSAVRGMLDGAVRQAVASVEFHTGLDNEAACAHLGQPGTLAVIASLTDNSPNTIYECIERAIPFLATTTGGTPELLAEADRPRCLVDPEPDAMAAALGRLLEGGMTPAPAAPAFDAETSLRLWDEVLDWRPSPRVEVREQPLVTTVVTHHDRPALLLTAVEAVDTQDYSNLELVIVDDGSREVESHRVLKEIEERPWRHPTRVVRQENRFLGAARNTGARAAAGDLVAFVDDDDVPMPHFISSLVTAQLASGADAVTCAMQSFDRPLGPPKPTDNRGVWVFLGDALHLAMVENCLGGAPVLLRRPALEAVGGYHEHHGLGFEDWQLYVRLLFAGHRLVTVPEPLYWYRILPGSMRATMSSYRSAQVVLDEFRKALPPSLRRLPDLAYGQSAIMRARAAATQHQVGELERVLWLVEEQLRRATRQPNGTADDGELAPGGRSVRDLLHTGRSQVTRAVGAARAVTRRGD